MLVVLLAAGAAVFVWLALEYQWFSSDISKSRARLPETVKQSLPASGNVLNGPQTTLLRYSRDISTGGAVLFTTNPGKKVVSFLTIPPVARLGGSELRSFATPELIDAFAQDTGVRISHVAVINLDNVGQLVDGVGGIHVQNPASFDVTVSGSTTWHFERGQLFLDGPHAVAYLRRDSLTGTALGNAGLEVLRGIVQAVLAPSSIGRLQVTGTALSKSAATDFSDADVIGLVYTRLNGGTAIECTLSPTAVLTSPFGRATIRRFLGQGGATQSTPCRARPIESQAFLPPKTVAEIVQRFGWGAFVAAAGLMLVLMLALSALLIWRVRRTPGLAPAGAVWFEDAAPFHGARSPTLAAPSPTGPSTAWEGRPQGERAPLKGLPISSSLDVVSASPSANGEAVVGAAEAERDEPARRAQSEPFPSPEVVTARGRAVPHEVVSAEDAVEHPPAETQEPPRDEEAPRAEPQLVTASVATERAIKIASPPTPARSTRDRLGAAVRLLAMPAYPVRYAIRGIGDMRVRAPRPSLHHRAAHTLSRIGSLQPSLPGSARRRRHDPGHRPIRRAWSFRVRRTRPRQARRYRPPGSRAHSIRRWIALHQDVVFMVGLAAVVAFLAGIFAGLI